MTPIPLDVIAAEAAAADETTKMHWRMPAEELRQLSTEGANLLDWLATFCLGVLTALSWIVGKGAAPSIRINAFRARAGYPPLAIDSVRSTPTTADQGVQGWLDEQPPSESVVIPLGQTWCCAWCLLRHDCVELPKPSPVFLECPDCRRYSQVAPAMMCTRSAIASSSDAEIVASAVAASVEATGLGPVEEPLTQVEYALLRGQLPLHRRLYLDVAVYTGARRMELEALDLSDVVRGGIQIRSAKPGAHRWEPIGTELHGQLVSGHRGGKLLEAWPDVEQDLTAACERANIRPRRFMALRLTFRAWWYRGQPCA